MKKITKRATAIAGTAAAITMFLFNPSAQADTDTRQATCGNFTVSDGSTVSYFWGNCGPVDTQIDVYQLPQFTFVTTLCAHAGDTVLVGRAGAGEDSFVALDMALPCP